MRDDTQVTVEFNERWQWTVNVASVESRDTLKLNPVQAVALAIDILVKAQEAQQRQAREPKKADR